MARPLSTEISKELGFSFNSRLAKNLSLWRNAVTNQDIDCCGIIDGKEGSGKSVFAQQIGVFLDADRTIDVETQIHFTAEKVEEAIHSLPPNKVIIWDEAGEGTDRRESTSKMNIAFNKMLKKARQFNQFLILVLPSFYDMDMYSSVWRTRYLINVFYRWDLKDRTVPLDRGYFRFYNENGKKSLYTNKFYRQQYLYPHLKNLSFDARFPHHYTVDEKKYREKKREAEKAHQEEAKKKLICPRCGSSIRFNHTKEIWRCRECDWSGADNERGNTIIDSKEKNKGGSIKK